jgi:hypothetical protein
LHKEYIFNTKYFIDFNTNKRYESYNPTININGNEINLLEITNYSIESKFELPTNFTIGNGVVLECAYQVREIDYLIEEDNSWNIFPIKTLYLNKIEEFKEWQKQCEENESELDSLIENKNTPNYLDNYNNWVY